MKTFLQNMEDFENRTFTANGCVTLRSSLNANVDMFGQASAMRYRPEEALTLFTKAWEEDANIAIRNLFYLRDVRGGQGERNIFRMCSRWLADMVSNETFEEFIAYIPEYGRWDDVIDVYAYMLNSTDVRMNYTGKIEAVYRLLQKQFSEDMKAHSEDKSISLLAKWFPLANNTRNIAQKKVAKTLSKVLFGSEVDARKVVVALRKHLNVLEQKLSKNEWEAVEYSTVPSCANKKYSNAFYKHDGDRYRSFIEAVNNGEMKMKAGTLYPYEIVLKASRDSKGREWDAMWKSLPDYTDGKSAICVVDVSGSMGTLSYTAVYPIHVALSLGLYFAERNEGQFKGKFFTFSHNPHIVTVKGNTLYERLHNMCRADWGMNTNIEKVFDLYLKLAKESKVTTCPDSLIIISDMEFDEASNANKTMFENIKHKFANEGIKVPNLVFWNVNASGKNVPVRYDEYGTVLVSGCSPSTFQYVMNGKTPEEFMLDILNGMRYSSINIFKRGE